MRDVTPLPVLEYQGGKITRPGIYRAVPIEVYHGDCCAGPSISSSGLRTIESESLEVLYDTHYLNPNRAEPEEKEAYVFGRATHTLFLGEKGFKEQFEVRPDKYPKDAVFPSTIGVPTDWHGGSKWCKTWVADRKRRRVQVIKPDWIPTFQAMAKKLAAHTAIQSGLMNGLIEHSMFWQDPKTGIWLKNRPDAVPLDSNMLSDYKTIDGNPSPIAVRRAITDHNYHMQMALGGDGMRILAGRRITDYFLVFQGKKRPHAINIKPLTPTAIDYGHRQNRRAIDKFAAAVKSGDWKGYDDDEVPAGLLEFRNKDLEFEANNNLLPEYEELEPLAEPEPPEAI